MAFSRHATEAPEDIDLGIDFYEQSIAAWGDDTPAVVYNNLGYILMAKVGRFDPAEGQGDQYAKAAEAFEADPNYANGHKAEIMEAYAHILHGLGRKDEAIELARRAWPLNRDNTDLEAWLNREYPGWDAEENDKTRHTAG